MTPNNRHLRSFKAYVLGVELLVAVQPIFESLRERHPQLAHEIETTALTIPAKFARGVGSYDPDRLRWFLVSLRAAHALEGLLDEAREQGLIADGPKERQLLAKVSALIEADCRATL